MFTNRKFRNQNRDGISIIEVLTSMAVATIGVFGVMVMIPFAVKQSQSGLDNDAANALGRNAIEEIQVQGLLEVTENNTSGDFFTRLMILAEQDGGGGPPPFYQNCSTGNVAGTVDFTNERATGLFHFDPIGVADGLDSFLLTDAANGDIEIYSATASRNVAISATLPAGGVFTVREASRMCRSRDELFHDADENNQVEVSPPQPLFDLSGTAQVKRQFSGRSSWSAFMVPEKDPFLASGPINRLRSYVVVYRDRERFMAATVPPPPIQISNRDLSTGPGTIYDYYQTDMAGTGFVAEVSQITFDPADTARPDTDGDGVADNIDTSELRRGDWVMLVNRLPEPTAGSIPPSNGGFRAAGDGYREQIMFARVNRVSGNSVTVEGGSFDFVAAGIPAPSGGLASSQTFMVHIKNAVNVFERSVSVER